VYHGERFNGYSHLLGFVLAVLGSAYLLGRTLGGGDVARTVAALVFSASMLAMYGASTLCHSIRGRARRFWQRADHCAIYLLIAGTYTPVALVTLEGPVGWSLFLVVWAAAITGILQELRDRTRERPSPTTYVGMGWLGVVAAAPIAQRMDASGVAWLVGGAALYTAGTYFYRNPRGWCHAHGAWHLFVLAGTACHYVAITWFIL
jgi:hemolysin III